MTTAIILAPEIANCEPQTDWDVVVSFLHWNGSHSKALTTQQQANVRTLADGFGKGITDLDLVWDWSHVRDSSEEAIKAIADKIKHFVL